MKKGTLLFLLILIFNVSIVSGNNAPADETGEPSLLVNTEWLAENIDDPSLIIMHVGKMDEYDEEHIPGAHLFPVIELFQPPGELNHEIPPIEKLNEAFRPFGINESSRIVLYYNEDWITVAARAYLTLDHIGLGNQTSILDGGLAQWLKDDRAITDEVPVLKGESVKLQVNKNVIVDVDCVKDNLRKPEVVLVDGRPEEYYDGSEKAEHVAKAGHIEGAISIPFNEITLEDTPYKFKPKEELEKLFMDAGIKESTSVISYCNTGVWASLVYFTAKYLGYESFFYDGSFEEWARDDSLPVTEPVSLNN